MIDKEVKYCVCGDVHGKYKLVLELLGILGFYKLDNTWYNPENFKLIFCGDLNDYTEDLENRSSLKCIDLCRELERDCGIIVTASNHQDKLIRYLNGNKVTPSHGLNNTIAELKHWSAEAKLGLKWWLESRPLYFEFEENDFKYVVVHAYFDDYMYDQTYEPRGLETKKSADTFKARCIYGLTNAEGRIAFWEGDWIERHITQFHLISGHYHATHNKENFTMIDTAERAIVYYLPGVNRIGVIK